MFMLQAVFSPSTMTTWAVCPTIEHTGGPGLSSPRQGSTLDCLALCWRGLGGENQQIMLKSFGQIKPSRAMPEVERREALYKDEVDHIRIISLDANKILFNVLKTIFREWEQIRKCLEGRLFM